MLYTYIKMSQNRVTLVINGVEWWCQARVSIWRCVLKKKKSACWTRACVYIDGKVFIALCYLKRHRDLRLATEAGVEIDHRNVKIYFAIILLLQNFMYKDLFVNIWRCKCRRSATPNYVFPTNRVTGEKSCINFPTAKEFFFSPQLEVIIEDWFVNL